MSDIEQEYSEEEQYEEESDEEPEEEIEEENDENEELEGQSIIETTNNLIEQVYISGKESRRTPNRLSKFEKTESMSIRIFQIQNNDKIYVPTAGLKSADEIAAAELLKGKSPLRLGRYIGTKIMPDGKPYKIYENYDVNDMQL